MNCLFSIHDVMPDTLPQVAGILELLRSAEIVNVTLLVVPGKPWDAKGLGQLHRWEQDGYELVGHGWHHHCHQIRGWYHRMHSLVLSRDVAEHLALTPSERWRLLERCQAWFAAHGFQSPRMYVPPAWALGRLPRTIDAEPPFRVIETLTGFLELPSGRMTRLPLVGFEADTQVRRLSLRMLNSVNRGFSRWTGLPLRVSIHPQDLQLLLAKDIERLVQSAQDLVWQDQPFGACDGATRAGRDAVDDKSLASQTSR